MTYVDFKLLQNQSSETIENGQNLRFCYQDSQEMRPPENVVSIICFSEFNYSQPK